MRLASLNLLALLASSVSPFVACSSSDNGASPNIREDGGGTDDAGGGGSGTADGGMMTTPDGGGCGFQPNSSAGCQTCFEQSCCSEAQACNASAQCTTLLACDRACAANDAACFQKCLSAAGPGQHLLEAMIDCEFGQATCAAACGATTDGGGGAIMCGGIKTGVAPCDSCIESSCCSEATACGTSGACLTVVDCVNNCNGVMSCEQGCGTTTPAGVSDANAINACLNSKCATQCAAAPTDAGTD